MIYIRMVHYEKDYHDNCEVITKMKYSIDYDNSLYECTKRQMIDKINLGYKAKTFYNGIIGEDVHVIDNSYLRTDANCIRRDNLSSLPRY